MYDNNYPNDYQNRSNSTSGEAGQSADSGMQNVAAQGNPPYGAGSYQHNANAGTGYGPYSGRYQHQGSYQNSYQYGNAYPNDYAQQSKAKEKKKEKREKSGSGYFKKALASISFGIFFGLFAGLGFYIVQSVTGNTAKADTEITVEKEQAVQETQEAVSESVKQEETKETASGIKQTDTITTVVSDVSDVVTEVMPSIVSINNHYTETMSYFGQSMTSEADASGSGIIVGENDTELLIVTNYHVIGGADKLTVQFVEGSEAEAFVKGMDSDMDLAVIAVPIKDIPSSTIDAIAVATLGDSDSLTVGEPAIAIGNSLGYGQSVTTGVISALDRNIELSDGSEGTFIQTDAAINPGNSGGALLNIKGEVVGINSNKIGGSVVEGMGYAIPISAANPIIAELMLKETKSKVAEEERGYLGISGISVTEEVSQSYGMPEGVYIAQVYDNTAAAAAGLQKGEIITEFNGEQISSMDELQRELEFYAKGDVVDVTVMTAEAGGYHSRTVQLTLGNKVQE